MSDLIQSRYQMLRAGYKKLADAKCKGCGAAIEWWQTTNGKRMPFDPIESDEAQTVTHWATCPDSAHFKPQPAAQPATRREALTAEARVAAVERLRVDTLALAVVALYAEGPVLAWVDGLTGEDYRGEFITAANLLRQRVDARAAEKTKRTA